MCSGSNIKYEYDHINNKLSVDRVIYSPVYYFFNYGYIPNTLGGDGDPLDAIVLCNYSIHPTAFIKCKMLGVIKTTDEKGQDDKIILVPTDSIDCESKRYNNISDLSSHTKARLICFLQDYKKLEPNKWVEVDENFGDKQVAYAIYKESMNNYIDNKI